MKKRNLYGLMVVFTLLASMTHVLGKAAAVAFPPLLLTSLRLLIATFTLVIVVKIRRIPLKIERSHRWAFVRLSLFGVVANILLFLWGLKYTIPAHPGLLYATTPVWTLIIAAMFGRETVFRRKVLGVSASVIGVAVILGGTILHLNTDYLLGDALVLLAVFCWSTYTVFSKPFVMAYPALTATFAITFIGMFVLLPLGAWQAFQFNFTRIPAMAWVGLFYMGIFTSATSYLIYYAVLKQIQPTQLAIIITGQAPMTALLSWLIQGYVLSWTFVVGSGITLFGIYLTLQLPSGAKKALKTQPVITGA